MFIQQLYTNCLAEAAYYIESEGEAAVIDPIRETEPYLQLAAERGAKIKYVFETHFHADFVSGHIDLARKAGAQIVYGPEANTGYEVYNAKDEETFKIGKLTLKVLHTPGHTLESTCYLLQDEKGKDHCIFTGDTLFVGDVGRPDLLDGVMTKEALAAMMYNSLNTKIKPLADNIIVYPAHGPGSACGKNIGKETWSTIGQQRMSNYAMQDMSQEKFVETLTNGLLPPPAYFFEDARINKQGYDNVDAVIERNLQPLSVAQFEQLMAEGAMVLDTRIPDEFEKGYVKGSINIGLNGQFASWVGSVININTPLILVTDTGKEHETVLRLSRVGYENVKGYLEGGFAAWAAAWKPVDQINSISPSEFATTHGHYTVIDVRKPGEYEQGHVKGAILHTLAELPNDLKEIDSTKPYLVHCAGGYRSMIACSILKANGFNNVTNVYGGFGKIKETGVAVEVSEFNAV